LQGLLLQVELLLLDFLLALLVRFLADALEPSGDPAADAGYGAAASNRYADCRLESTTPDSRDRPTSERRDRSHHPAAGKVRA